MSINAATNKLSSFELLLLERSELNRSLIPYASSLDILIMKIQDLTDSLKKEHSSLRKVFFQIKDQFMNLQLEVEMVASFCPTSAEDPQITENAVKGIKSVRDLLKTKLDNHQIVEVDKVDVLAKSLFFTELCLKKPPVFHLVQPFETGGDIPKAPQTSDIIRYVAHLSQWYGHMCRKYDTHLAFVDHFLAEMTFTDESSILENREIIEAKFQHFLYDLLVLRKESMMRTIVKRAQAMDKISVHGRLVFLLYVKALRLFAVTDRYFCSTIEALKAVPRLSKNEEIAPIYLWTIDRIVEMGSHIGQRLGEITKQKSYPEYIRRLDCEVHEAIGSIIKAPSHTEETMIESLGFVATRLNLEKVASFELLIELYSSKKMLEDNNHDLLIEKMVDAFNKLVEQCESSIEADIDAKQLKQMLYELAPYIKGWSLLRKLLNDLCILSYNDVLNPKPPFDLEKNKKVLEDTLKLFVEVPIEAIEDRKLPAFFSKLDLSRDAKQALTCSLV